MGTHRIDLNAKPRNLHLKPLSPIPYPLSPIPYPLLSPKAQFLRA